MNPKCILSTSAFFPTLLKSSHFIMGSLDYVKPQSHREKGKVTASIFVAAAGKAEKGQIIIASKMVPFD